MRPLIAIVVSSSILGGLHFYMQSRSYPKRNDNFNETFAEGNYSLDVRLTFRADRNPFAFDPENDPTVLVRFRGEEILRKTAPVEAGIPLTVDRIENIVAGDDEISGANEFYFEILDGDDSHSERGVRFRIFRDDQPVVDETRWSAYGEPVSGTVRLVVPRSDHNQSHEHE